jgi:CzcA family heavy metal efflux pump
VQWLVSLCVRHAAAVAAIAALLTLLGIWDARTTPLDVFPEFVPAQVSIQTEAPGLAPDQVEALVTRPVEAAVNGAPGLERMRSESIPGLSVISLDFGADADARRAHQDIAERLSRIASALPAGIGVPKLSPLTSSTMDLLKIGLVSEKLDAYALRDIADWVVKPQLLGVPGVARVNVYGGAVRQIQILPDLEKLAAYGVGLGDLGDAARAAVSLHGAGFVDLAAQRVLVESPVPAPDAAAIARAVVTVRNGTPITLGDLARVEIGAALEAGQAVVQGTPGVLLTISSQYGANTMTATRAVEGALRDLAPRLAAQGITIYPALHRPATFIERALTNLRDSLAIAAVLILLVLLAFLRDWRSAFISFITIPLSLLAAVVVLKHLGLTLNTMTLGGFAVAIGVLVDDAIIDVENILRRLHLNANARSAPKLDLASEPERRLAVVRDASLEIRGPVLYATLAVLIVFLPVLLTTGVQGRFVGPLALAFMLAVLASLLVALTVTPALSALLLSPRAAHASARWILALERLQACAVTLIGRRLAIVAGALAAATIGALLWLPSLGGQFMPEFREGHFVVQASSAAPGTSFEEMMRLGERVSRDLLALPYIATVAQQIGRAELGEDTWGPNRSELHVELKANARVDQRRAQDEIRRVVESYPGLRTEVVTFLGDRLSESLTGETAAVVVDVFGDDLDALDAAGTRIAAALADVPGVVDLQFARESAGPEIMVRPDSKALAEYGLTRAAVLDAVQTAFAGLTVGQTFAGARTVDVVLILPASARHRLETLDRLTVSGPFGPVPLNKVAHITPAAGRATIRHLDGQRRVVVTFNVADRPLQSVVTDARDAVAALGSLPGGVYVRFEGQGEAERAARLELGVLSALAAGGVLLMLFLCFRRRAYPWLVLVNLPFSLIGSILAIGIIGIGLSIGTLVGLVTVFGISARNAILLLAHYEHLVDVEGRGWNRATVLDGAGERLVPILMTALVTALGLAPLAAGMGRVGYEIEGPMAVTVLGGLATSTLLNLLVLPALAQRFGTSGPGAAAPACAPEAAPGPGTA